MANPHDLLFYRRPLSAIQFMVTGGLEPIPAATWLEAGYTVIAHRCKCECECVSVLALQQTGDTSSIYPCLSPCLSSKTNLILHIFHEHELVVKESVCKLVCCTVNSSAFVQFKQMTYIMLISEL